MENIFFEKIISLLTEKTGIEPLETHRESIKKIVLNRANEIFPDDEKCVLKFFDVLETDKNEFQKMINACTVNETYFFREEGQFDFLKKSFQKKDGNQKLKIWSAACSTGEEAYSLLLLALSFGFNVDIFASDINSAVLEFCRNGVYQKNKSIRSFDGLNYKHLLEPYIKEDKIIFPQEIKNKINSMEINLKNIEEYKNLPEDLDVIFIRNIFIYFDDELRKIILDKMCQHLKTGGLLFVSISETASISKSILPQNLVLRNSENIFYFEKV